MLVTTNSRPDIPAIAERNSLSVVFSYFLQMNAMQNDRMMHVPMRHPVAPY